jgi:CubicO group peptidase (beta-lactamase class C family)
MRKLAFSVALAVMALGSGPASPGSLPMTAPERVGMSSEGLERLTRSLRAEVDEGRLPGAVVAVARRGQLAYFEAVGFRDPGAKVPMPKDAIFSIASMTKPMVSVAIMALQEDGRLLLSDPIGKYLPGLANMRVATAGIDRAGTAAGETVPAERQPSILDLLRHTSGFTYGGSGTTDLHRMWPAWSAASSTTYTASEFIEKLSKAPLLHQPGTVWEYSLSVDVLGLVVEAVSGKSLGSFLRERIWQPLGMIDTGFSVPEAKRERYALAFAKDPLTNMPQSMLHAGSEPLKFECGGGCAVSTAMDYLRFAQMLANKGILDGRRILAAKNVELMTTDQLPQDVRAHSTSAMLAEDYGFGLGLAVRTRASKTLLGGTVGEFYWGGASGTYFWVDPKEELVVVFMAATPTEIRDHFRRLVRTFVQSSIVD